MALLTKIKFSIKTYAVLEKRSLGFLWVSKDLISA